MKKNADHGCFRTRRTCWTRARETGAVQGIAIVLRSSLMPWSSKERHTHAKVGKKVGYTSKKEESICSMLGYDCMMRLVISPCDAGVITNTLLL